MAEPCVMYTDFNEIVAIPCSGHRHQSPKAIAKRLKKSSTKVVNIPRVKAQFHPALCYLCRLEAEIIDRYGWCYLSQEEANMITLTRRFGFLDMFMLFLKNELKGGEGSVRRELFGDLDDGASDSLADSNGISPVEGVEGMEIASEGERNIPKSNWV